MSSSNAHLHDGEAMIKRNPHPDFKKVEESRPVYQKKEWAFTQTPAPSWTPGCGANNDSWKEHKTISIDPYEDGRVPVDNYKLLISGIVPRPIGLISTVSADGKSRNLAPFSYFTYVSHDPPIFVIGFAGSMKTAKDSLANILETKGLVVNMISEHFIEAANYTSINSPRDVSEWDLTGLTPVASERVKAPRIGEAVFAVEAKMVDYKEWHNADKKATGCTLFAEGVMFHVREDALNEQRNLIDPGVLKPVARVGGITYTTINNGFELTRPDYDKEMANPDGLLKNIVEKAQ